MKHIYFFKNRPFYIMILLFFGVFGHFQGFSKTVNSTKIYLPVLIAPVIENQNFTIAEGSIEGAIVGTITATAEGNIRTYSIVSGAFLTPSSSPMGDSSQDPDYDASTIFLLNSETGLLRVNNPKYLIAVQGSIALEVQVTDDAGEKASATITVQVSDMETTVSDTIELNWTTATNHPQGHGEATGGAVNNKLLVFGGFTATFAPKAAVFALNVIQNSWSRLKDMPPMASNSRGGGATHMGWTDDGTDIYIAAGYAANASGNAQQFGARRVYKYTVAEDRYDELPQLPIDRSAGALEYIDNKLYYVAGTNRARNEDQSDLLVLDLANLSTGWSYLSQMPNPRNHIGSAVFDGKLYVFGGQKEHDEELVPQDDVHRYDPETNAWTQLADMPQPFNHIHASVFVYGDFIYSIGGQIAHNATPYASVYAYDPEINTWKKFTDLPAKRFSVVGGGINGKLYASGGNNSRTTYMADLPEAFLSLENDQNTTKNAQKGIKIYPIPAKNSVFISKDNGLSPLTDFTIYDLNGRVLNDFSAENVKNGNSYQLPISGFSAGLYVLRLKTEDGNVITKRLLIQ